MKSLALMSIIILPCSFAGAGSYSNPTGRLFEAIGTGHIDQVHKALALPELNFTYRLDVAHFDGEDTAELCLVDYALWKGGEQAIAILEALLNAGAPLHYGSYIRRGDRQREKTNALRIAAEKKDLACVRFLFGKAAEKRTAWNLQPSFLQNFGRGVYQRGQPVNPEAEEIYLTLQQCVINN